MSAHVVGHGKVTVGGQPIGRMWPEIGASGPVTTWQMTDEERERYMALPLPPEAAAKQRAKEKRERRDAEMPAHVPPETKAQALQMLRDGKSPIAVSEALGIHTASTYAWRKQLKIQEMQDERRDRKAPDAPVVNEETGTSPENIVCASKEGAKEMDEPGAVERGENDGSVKCREGEDERIETPQSADDDPDSSYAESRRRLGQLAALRALEYRERRTRMVQTLRLAERVRYLADAEPATVAMADEVAEWAAGELAR